MELEKLNKTQIVLLTLLVSFVTSIATGIVTVTLMAQTPPGATYSISKVIERTVEKIVPERSQSATTVKTVVIKEEDVIADAVERNTNNVVRLFAASAAASEDGGPDAPEPEPEFVSVGFMLSGDGLLVTDAATVSDNTSYILRLSDGTEVSASAVFQDEDSGIALMQALDNGEDNAAPRRFSAATLADSNKVRLGQTTLVLAGKSSVEVSQGIISSIKKDTKMVEESPAEGEETAKKEKELKYVSAIKTNIVLPKSSSGSPLVNTDGNIIGMNLTRDGETFAVASTLIKDAILSLESKNKEADEGDVSDAGKDNG